jgi:hypothetical protein
VSRIKYDVPGIGPKYSSLAYFPTLWTRAILYLEDLGREYPSISEFS